MAKKKGGKQQKKGGGVNQDFGGISLENIADRGAQWLKKDNAREALKAFKFLKNSGYDSGIVALGLFDSYLLRYGQLMEKSMVKEADVVLDLAFKSLPTGIVLPLESLSKAIRLLPLPRAVSLYRDALKSMDSTVEDSLPEFERMIANRAVLEDGLDTLDALPGHLALVKEKEVLKHSAVTMDAGRWSEAVKDLAGISRKSPFVDIKVFSKLMSAFADQDKPGVQRALSMLGKGFPLPSLLGLLSSYAAAPGLPGGLESSETATLLWGQASLNDGYARILEGAVAEGTPGKIGRAVEGLTAKLDSPDKGSAVEFLAETVGHGLLDKTKDVDYVLKLLKKMPLPDPQFMLARIVGPRGKFLNDYTETLWMKLDLLFSDPKDKDLAKALILVTMAEKMNADPSLMFGLKDELNGFFKAIGTSVRIDKVSQKGENTALVQLDILQLAYSFDPENRRGFDLILKIPIDSPSLRKALPPLLESMADVFPDDPGPCLRLARLFLKKSAVRKAEAALKKAFSRAPHDGEVLEQYALCHVITACKNLKLGKYELTLKDLAAAEEMGVSRLGVYIQEKRLLCTFLRDLKFSKKMFEEISSGLSLADTIKLLALFKLDLEDPDCKCPENPRGLASVFNKHKMRIKELNPGEIASLLRPIPPLCQVLYRQGHYARFLLDKRAGVLNSLTDRDFISIAIDLVRFDYLDQVISQLGKRISPESTNDDAISMEFLHLSLCHIRDGDVPAFEFESLVDSSSTQLKERLRMISRQVAGVAPEKFREAFETFNFNLLDMPSFGGGMPFDFNSEVMDGFGELIDQLVGGGGGEGMENILDSVIGELRDIYDFDDDDYYDDDYGEEIDLDNFNAKKVFGSRVDPEGVFEIVLGIVGDTLYLDETSGLYNLEDNAMDLIESLNELMDELRQSGFKSADDFRSAGKKFYPSTGYGQRILLGFSKASKRSGALISKDLKSFILGMKQSHK